MFFLLILYIFPYHVILTFPSDETVSECTFTELDYFIFINILGSALWYNFSQIEIVTHPPTDTDEFRVWSINFRDYSFEKLGWLFDL